MASRKISWYSVLPFTRSILAVAIVESGKEIVTYSPSFGAGRAVVACRTLAGMEDSSVYISLRRCDIYCCPLARPACRIQVCQWLCVKVSRRRPYGGALRDRRSHRVRLQDRRSGTFLGGWSIPGVHRGRCGRSGSSWEAYVRSEVSCVSASFWNWRRHSRMYVDRCGMRWWKLCAGLASRAPRPRRNLSPIQWSRQFFHGVSRGSR